MVYRIGNYTFETFQKVVIFASFVGYIFDPDIKDMVEDFETLACLELEEMMIKDNILY